MAFGVGGPGASGDEPRRGANREGVVQLPPRAGALGALHRQEPYRPATHQAQGRELGTALSRLACGGEVGGTGGRVGRRGRGVIGGPWQASTSSPCARSSKPSGA